MTSCTLRGGSAVCACWCVPPSSGTGRPRPPTTHLGWSGSPGGQWLTDWLNSDWYDWLISDWLIHWILIDWKSLNIIVYNYLQKILRQKYYAPNISHIGWSESPVWEWMIDWLIGWLFLKVLILFYWSDYKQYCKPLLNTSDQPYGPYSGSPAHEVLHRLIRFVVYGFSTQYIHVLLYFLPLTSMGQALIK